MARVRRHKSEPIPKRKRGAGAQSESEKPVLLSRRIVDSETSDLSASATFAEALTQQPTHDSAASGSFTQVVVPKSTPELLAEIASAWELHPVLVEDLFHANQRPKIDRYDDVLFVVLKSAVYIDSAEEVEFKEFHLLMKDDVLVIICQDDRFIDGSPIPHSVEDMHAYFRDERRQWASDRELLLLGPRGARLPAARHRS